MPTRSTVSDMKPSADEIKFFIKEKFPGFEPSSEPVELSGGNLNYVWRVPGNPYNVIVKHAPPFIASNPEESLNPDRLWFEALALRLFIENGRLSYLSNKDISAPHFYGYDSEKNMLLMEDIGSESTLFSDYMFRDYDDFMPAILGKFIANLHRQTAGKSFFKDSFQNINIQKTRLQVQYRGAGRFLENAGIEPDPVAVKNAERLGEKLLSPGKCLVMGDLWPSSILIDGHKMRLIDWEFCHYGRPFQDIAHFVAHCKLHTEASDHKKWSGQIQQFQNHFLNSYKSTLGSFYEELFDDIELRGFNIHYAMEILIRTVGVFKQGYLFEKYPPGHLRIQRLVQEAHHHLKYPGSEQIF